ncbi:MAG: hypothetical protein QNK05_19575 [Myxococcota bacterium]|nr:hypothetical protein [Myxococcota bacterium]
MSDEERMRRPPPERTQPDRGWGGAFGRHSGSRRGPGDPSIEQGVDSGYRLVDEYLRQGMGTARRFSDRAMPGGMGASLQGMQEMWLRQAAEFWMGLLPLAPPMPGAMPNVPPPSARAPAFRSNQAEAEPASAASAPRLEPEPRPAQDIGRPIRVVVGIDGPGQVEVSVDLTAGHSHGEHLRVQDPRAVRGDAPRLREVSIDTFATPSIPTIRARIPLGQAPGLYEGAIVDEATSERCGTLRVRIDPARSDVP